MAQFNLHWDFTAWRPYDYQLGRFWGVDALADWYSSVSPMQYGLNNPVVMNDPTGLHNECPECDKDAIMLPEVTVTPQSETPRLSYYIMHGDPITRYAAMQVQSGNRAWVSQAFSKSNQTIHYGGEVAPSQWMQDFNNSFGKALIIGVNGSLLAYAADPMVVKNYGDIGTVLEIVGESIVESGEYRSRSLYQQGFRRGLNGNYQLKGRNFSLFRNQLMTSATKPINTLAPLGKTLGGAGTAISAASLYFDIRNYSRGGDLSGYRLTYKVTGTAASVGVGVWLGGPYGVATGAIFSLGEKAWDITQPTRDEISRQYSQIENALRNGWRPVL